MRTVADLMKLSFATREEIKQVFGSRLPFGPSSADDFDGFSDVGELIFSTENQVWREYLTHPRMIVGRKGSGKSSVLKNTWQSGRYRLVHRVSTSDMFLQCIETLFKDTTDLRTVSAETSAKVWSQMINTSLMTELLKRDADYDFPRISRYFEVCGLMNERNGRNLFVLVRNLRSGEGSETSTIVNMIVSAILHFRRTNGLEYDEAVREMDDYLSERHLRTVVILDSVEEYPLQDHQFDAAIKGLLKCAGSYGGVFRDIRFGIAAELYYDLQKISSNLMKDFANAMVLHWSPMELLRLIAWRHLIYLAAHDAGRLKDFSSVDLGDREDVQRVIASFFPKEIKNRAGRREIGVAYVLRHTQLLPRQLVMIFNETFSTQRPNVPQTAEVAANSIIGAIQGLESRFCNEIFNAFKSKYPFAQALCEECLPSLARFFDERALEKVYREKGKKVLQEFSHFREVSFREFKQALFEIGAVGRVKPDGKTEIYADADFEYALPGRLYASATDELCLHPSFSGTYETNANRVSEHFVYPHMQLYDAPSDRRLRLL